MGRSIISKDIKMLSLAIVFGVWALSLKCVESQEQNVIYLSPYEGMDCTLKKVKTGPFVKPVSERCWSTFPSLVDQPSALRTSIMGIDNTCMNQFYTLRDIAKDGRPKFMYKDVLVRCITSRFDVYVPEKKSSWWSWFG